MALTEAAEEGLSIKRQLVAITSIPADLIEVEAFCDNHDVVSSVFSTKDTCKSVRVRVDVMRM